MNWNSLITMLVIYMAILIALVVFGIVAAKRAAFRFTTQSKIAVALIFVGLATIAALSVGGMVFLYVLPSLPLEADSTFSLSRYTSSLYWIAAFFAFVFIGTGLLLVTRVIGRIETTLAQSEDRYRTIVEDQTEFIVRWDSDGIRTWMNDAYCEYFQQSREELLGTSFFSDIPEAVRKKYLESFRSLTPDAPSLAGEHTTILPDGSLKWQDWTSQAIFDREGKITECQSVGRDITARKTAEFALIDSELQYRNLVENITDWVWQLDLEGNHTYTNSRLEVILGYSAQELSAISLKKLLHPEDFDKVNARLAGLIVEKQGWRHWLWRVLHKDGDYRYLDSNATPLLDSSGVMTGWSGINRDVTFKTLLAQASSDLLAANLGSAQIKEALRKFGEYFRVDRFELWWRDESGENTERTYSWTRAGVALTSSTYKVSALPLTAAQIADRKVMRVADTRALLPEDFAESAIADLIDSRAFALFPLRVSLGKEGRERIGSGIVNMLESARSWTEEEVNELHLAFNVIATAEARLRTESELKDRDRFNTLIAEVSTDLLEVSDDDSSLTEALRRFAIHFKVDSLSCWWFDGTRESLRRSCIWHSQGLDPGPSVIGVGSLPYYQIPVLAGEVVRVADVNELHPEASAERALYESMGVTASLIVPLKLSARLENVGCGIALKYGETRDWLDQEVEDLQLAFNVMVIAEARKRTERQLKGRERFRTFLAEISTNLLEAHQDEIGEKIDSALNLIAQHHDLDRASLWYFEDNKRMVRCVHQWSPQDRERPIGGPVALDTIPWAGARMLSGKDIQLETIEDIPLEYEEDRAFFEAQGLKSELALPLVVDNQQVGVGIFITAQQARTWPEKTVSELRLLAEVLVNAYTRAETTRTIQQRERDLIRSEALASVGSYSFIPNTSLDDWPPSGKLKLSEEMRKLLDFTDEEGGYDDIISRIHSDDRARVLSVIRELLQGEGSVTQHEYRLVRPDGEIIQVEDRTEVDRSGDGPQIVKVFGTLKNISERVLRENELRDALVEIEKLKKNLEEENLDLRDEIKSAHGFDKIIGNSESLRRCLDLVKKVAPTDATVMLLGETGSGKELIANAVHDQSARKDKRLVSVNCAALPGSLIESELFGHEKGAFTGAGSMRKGRFELADGGTLFLDEIGELPLSLQSKLLRAIQEGEFERLGGSNTLKVDVRIIAATNRQLKAFVEQGEFRADLYYRISNFPIEVPSLNERKEDIPLLAEYFVRKFAPELGKNINAISSGMLRYLSERTWPGNVRELEGFIQHELITNEGDTLTLSVQKEETTQSPSGNGLSNGGSATLSDVEHTHITDVLNQTGWRISGENGAAQILGVPSSTLRSRMKKLGIEHPEKSSAIE